MSTLLDRAEERGVTLMRGTPPYMVGVPGVYRDIPMALYHALPGASSSQLKELEKSPAHLEAYRLGKISKKNTKSTRFGSALHCAVLEPHLFDETYAIAQTCFERTEKGERCSRTGTARIAGVTWSCGQHLKGRPVDAGFEIITQADRDKAFVARDAILSHEMAAWVLSKVTHRELTALWVDPETGCLCRMRTDAVAPSIGATVEIKSAVDASITGFSKSIYNWRYYRQGAQYLDGANEMLVADEEIAALLPEEGFTKHIIIALESGDFPAVNVFPLRGDAIEAGRMELLPLRKLYVDCATTGVWPQRSREYKDNEMTDISLPPWSWKEIDERLARGAN